MSSGPAPAGGGSGVRVHVGTPAHLAFDATLPAAATASGSIGNSLTPSTIEPLNPAAYALKPPTTVP